MSAASIPAYEGQIGRQLTHKATLPSALEDVSGRLDSEGAVEPFVELGDVGARGDLLALLGGHVNRARIYDLEDVFPVPAHARKPLPPESTDVPTLL
jgi:hypothetical protein